jgi:UDP-glucose 6-dehydrogenase
MKIGIIGAGRLGLTFALLCEKNGYDVIVSDVREDYVFNLNQNICLTNEPLIQSMLFNV